MLRRCFPWWSRALGSLVLLLKPAVFQREFLALGQLGRATHPSQFGPEFEAYVYETVRDKARFRTRTLGLRMSRRRFERLAWEVWRSEAPRNRRDKEKDESPEPPERESEGVGKGGSSETTGPV